MPTQAPAPTRAPQVVTPEQIARNYKAALDSVNLITTLAARNNCTKEELASIVRNKEHLKIMVAKSYWTNEDLKPLHDAINAVVNTPVTPTA